MTTSVLSSKGQIVIPRAVREKMGLHAGDRVEFIEDEGGFKIIPATRDIRALKGILPRPARPVTIEEMNQTIRERAAAVRQPRAPYNASAGTRKKAKR